jgi:hypothetical protein
LLLGLSAVAGQGSIPDAHASRTTVFSIAPGDAERVPLDRDDGVCTLAEAVEASNDQGMSNPPLNDCGSASVGLNIIELQAGDYDLTAQVAVINGGNTATFSVVTPITVRGVTSDTTRIRRTAVATDEFRFFHVGGNGFLTLENLGLEGGYANAGSGGGAVHVISTGYLVLTRTQMLANTARYGGALYTAGSTTIANSSFLGNSASENEFSQGGAIYVSNHMTMTTSSVTGNESHDDGGGIYINSTGSGAAWISLSNISNNASNSDLTDGGDGGGIYHHVGVLTSTFNSLMLNVATPSLQGGESRGGGIFSEDTANLFYTLVDGNAAENGAGLFNETTASTTVTSTLFIANLASETGGGIANRGDLSLNNAIAWANVAQGDGGGVHNDTQNGPYANLRNSTFYQNISANGSGGGIFNRTGPGVWTALSNVTVAANNASGDGAGIANDTDGRIVVASSTIANNSASGAGGGISSLDPITDHVRTRNTILTGNSSGGTDTTENCNGALTSQGYNLDSGSGCLFTGPGDISNGNASLASLAPADPLLVLQGNITPAYDLQADSDAINAANPVACYDARNLNNNDMPLFTDQWGQPRVKQGRCDIGSIETDSTPTAVTLTGLDAGAAGAGNLPTPWQAGLLAILAALLWVAAARLRRRRMTASRVVTRTDR